MTTPVRVPAEVNFNVNGVEKVRNGLRLVGKDGEANLQKIGSSSRQLAGGVEAIARAGKLTGDGMKQILQQGAEMAFAFGAGGPIVGALAITGLAIFEHITGKMREAREETNRTRTALEDLGRGDLMAAANRQQRLFSGDKFAIQKEGESSSEFFARRYGVEGLRRQVGVVAGQISSKYGANRERVLADAQAFALGGVPLGQRPGKEMTTLIELFKQLSKMEPEFQAVSRITANLANAEGQRAKTGFQLSIDKAQQDAADAAMAASAKNSDAALQLARLDQQKQFAGLGVQSMFNGYSTSKIEGSAVAAQIKPQLHSVQEQLAIAFQENVQMPLEETIRSGIGSMLGNAIAEGITAGFEGGGISGAFKAAGKAILAGLGGIMQQMGEVWVSYGISMTALGQALWNPITSGPAAIAIGSALIAPGAAAGAVAHGKGAGAGGGGSSPIASSTPQIIDRGLIDPTRALMTTAGGMTPKAPMYVTIIGPNDPTAQRAFQELQRNANARGSLG